MPTVLLVDDEPLIRWSIGEWLRTEGYDVLEAPTGRAAIEHVRKGVDLVLLDSKLPDMRGERVLRQITEIDPDAFVVLLTADAEIETAVKAMNLGPFLRIDKPFLLEDIAAIVKRVCALRVFSHPRGNLRTA